MLLDTLSKLHKLRISNRDDPSESFEAMFNPTSFSMKHENIYQKAQGINTSGRKAEYIHSRSEVLALDLTLDGTGVSEYGTAGPAGPGRVDVSDQIEKFLDLCFHMDGDRHEPKKLKIQWGQGALQNFQCRLKSVDINYTSFLRNGAPLRAVLTTAFVEDVDPGKLNRGMRKSSPDLSHRRVVLEGDTLPLLCKQVYGSSEHYLKVARDNQLDDFRKLSPGQEIIFRPIKS